MNRLHLDVFESARGDKSRRVTRLTQDHSARPIEIFHELDRLIPLTPHTPLDGHVLVTLLYAAAVGKPLMVHGPMTRTAMRNIEEFLLAWNRWKPNRYHRIDIMPERVIDVRRGAGEETAIAAFSGGVDATFSALRHAYQGQKSPTRYPLRSVLMVHGFDVDVYNADDFKKITARVKPLLEMLNLDIRVTRTNSRELRLQYWDDSSALELAGCLHMHAGDFQFGLIGSSKPYEALILPCGSNPITDHLMSGDQFAVVHDGCGFSRTDKVSEIMNHPLACRTLKVCWAGADQSENCGRCEKCVRTHLNFLAAGAVRAPPCFPGDLDVDYIKSIEINNRGQLLELSDVLAHAIANKISGAWIPVLQERLAAWRPADAAYLMEQAGGGPIKRSVARSLAMMGVDEPVKRAWRYARRGILKSISQLTGSTQIGQLQYQMSTHGDTTLAMPKPAGERRAGDAAE